MKYPKMQVPPKAQNIMRKIVKNTFRHECTYRYYLICSKYQRSIKIKMYRILIQINIIFLHIYSLFHPENEINEWYK